MSLKDRLNSSASANNAIKEKIKEEIKEDIKYYSSSEATLEINNLGIVDTLLADDEINAIFVNGAKNIYIDKKGKSFKSSSEFKNEIQLETLIKKYIEKKEEQEEIVNSSKFYKKFNHEEGINLEVILPPLSEKLALNVKVYKDKFANLQNMQENQSISKETALVLEAFSAIKCNILIVGEKNTLKTSLLSALAKKIPTNFRGVMIDFSNELKINSNNFSNFDFSKIQDEKETKEIFEAVNLSAPEKIFINDINEALLAKIAKASLDNLKGINATLSAKSPKAAMEKIAYAILKYNPEISFEMAKILAYQAFDVVIFTTLDGNVRKIYSLSELKINPNKECLIEDIFSSKMSPQIQSTGLTPDFYEIIKLSSLPINANIFDENYKHTFFQNPSPNIGGKTLNLEILKKFKRDLPAKEDIKIEAQKEYKKEEEKEEIGLLFEEKTKEEEGKEEIISSLEDKKEFEDGNLF